MAQKNADVLEVLISQMAEGGQINAVLRKALCVFGHAERCQPLDHVEDVLVVLYIIRSVNYETEPLSYFPDSQQIDVTEFTCEWHQTKIRGG